MKTAQCREWQILSHRLLGSGVAEAMWLLLGHRRSCSMPVIPALRDYLLTRRSVGIAFLREPGPNPAELEQILPIGTRVPDNGKITPWRLVIIAGDDRVKAGAVLADIAARNTPDLDDASLDIERQRFLPAPLTIGVISSPQPHPKVPEFEQLLSAGNV